MSSKEKSFAKTFSCRVGSDEFLQAIEDSQGDGKMELNQIEIKKQPFSFSISSMAITTT
jgi:uncharacterized protein (DUF2141 family)